jgi:TM2 domain-containing membrane protein YozV
MESQKRRSTVMLLCCALGCLGAHRFYLRQYRSAAIQLLTLGGAGIWMAIDLIFIACGAFKDKEGMLIRKW